MKTFPVVTLSVLVVLSLCPFVLAADVVEGIVLPVSPEKIEVAAGDNLIVTLGEKDGIIKGDIGSIVVKGSDTVIGQCAVTSSGYQSSICDIIKARHEIEKGNIIRFPRTSPGDPTLYPFALQALVNIVEPYQPYKHLRVAIYGIYDDRNMITQLSQHIVDEFENLFGQKKRIQIVDKKLIKDTIIYPDDSELRHLARTAAKRANLDVLVIGKYSVNGNKMHLTLTNINRAGSDNIVRYIIPIENKHETLASATISGPFERTHVERVDCTIWTKAIPYQPRKDEKWFLLKQEAADNPFLEGHLKGVDFNLLNPVEISITIDDEVLPAPARPAQIQLSKGVHRVVVSFKRGYFFNDSLLYTSKQEVRKEAFLDISKKNNIILEVQLNPLFGKEMIALNAYEHAERERQIIKPIYRVQTEKTIERFKD
jgi:hypothetical protein